jgi:hypothetical protein
MPIAYIHLSDIHFGQEVGGDRITHDDVKERLIEDAARQIKEHGGGTAAGIIVTGDAAYAGKANEYEAAGAWLDRLTAAVNCSRTAVQVVPGNHDIDRGGISHGCKLMLDQVIAHGEAKLDSFLESKLDCELLYAKFAAYRPFAEGYDCALDHSGGPASDRTVELAPGRVIRFIGLNSALICSANDVEGRLLLGAAQRVLPRTPGEELVVLCHHPLNWLQDSDEARRYVRNRARVFVSGHEHNPSLKVDNIREGCDLMMLAAGAAVPPKADGGFTYCYNVLIFDWDANTDGLKVTIVPRCWSEEDKDFEADDIRLGRAKPTVSLGCPNFRLAPRPAQVAAAPAQISQPEATPEEYKPMIVVHEKADGGRAMANSFQMVLLKFFRDLSPAQRLTILVDLKVLPADFRDNLTIEMERRVVDSLLNTGRLSELEDAISKIQQIDNSGEKP